MEDALLEKIKGLLDLGLSIDEHQVRALMIIIRKRLDMMTEKEKLNYLTVRLFGSWAAHIKIDQSITGLRILARINDTLVRVKDSASTDEVLKKMSQAIGFDVLYSELILLFNECGISHKMGDKNIQKHFTHHIIEIIRDVPITFLPTNELKGASRKIYDQIAQNPIKPGAGVISLTLSEIDSVALSAKNLGVIMCLKVLTEDKITIVFPFSIE